MSRLTTTRLSCSTWNTARLALAAALLACGCVQGGGLPGDEPAQAGEGSSLSNRLAAMDTDLSLGSQGADVVALHEYLAAYGYLPNAELAVEYPNWKPVVTPAPAAPDVFDGQTELAVRALQQDGILEPTGVVDSATRDLLRMARSGTPVNIESEDPRNKWALLDGAKLGSTTVTWRLTNTDDVTLTSARTAVANAFATWAAQTSLTIKELTSGTATITLSFVAPSDGALANTSWPTGGGVVIKFNPTFTWSVSSTTPAGQYDLQSAATHEIGHALGVHHSSVSSVSVMWPWAASGAQKRVLTGDDKIAISALYDLFQALSGGAHDVGVGGDDLAWKIGVTPTYSEGYNIAKWNGSSWTNSEGSAVRISVAPNGIPWVVDNLGSIYYRTTNSPTSGGWMPRPGCAQDIAVGPDSSVWIIGCSTPGTNGGIFRWNGTGWDQAEGGAVRIAVAVGGIPWVVDQWHYIYRRTSNSPFSGGWNWIPGQARDVGAGVNGDVWVTGTEAGSGGGFIYVWDEQSASGTDAPARAEWVRLPGSATDIAVGPKGPWVVDSSLTIYRTFK